MNNYIFTNPPASPGDITKLTNTLKTALLPSLARRIAALESFPERAPIVQRIKNGENTQKVQEKIPV